MQPEKQLKCPVPLNFSSKLFDFDIADANEFFINQMNNPNNNEKILKGFAKFIMCLDEYFEILNINSAEGSKIKIFGTVTLRNNAIVHATNKFYNQPWFSNIAINMDNEELFDYQTDNGICYAQVYNNNKYFI